MKDDIVIILLVLLVLENSRYFFEWFGRQAKNVKHAIRRGYGKIFHK